MKRASKGTKKPTKGGPSPRLTEQQTSAKNAKDANARTLAPVCPRCGGSIPSEDGALSRADNKTEVCSACGIEETINDLAAWEKAGKPQHYVPGNTKADWKRPEVARALLTSPQTFN